MALALYTDPVTYRNATSLVVCLLLMLTLVVTGCVTGCGTTATDMIGRFDSERDLFLPQFDSKTDVDDLHSAAGVATLLADPRFSGVKYLAVAGAYGMQEGLFVPAPELFDAAFGEHWSDAHENLELSLVRVTSLVTETLRSGGQVWVAEAGQSDFTADWLKRIESMGLPTRSVHVVQHSDWNEEVTTPGQLAYVKETASYHRIADGNVAGNGTPGFKNDSGEFWPLALASGAGNAWRLARIAANRYNGVEGRYLNEAIETGGVDFSDVSETCWIFGLEELVGPGSFFDYLGSE
jgi:hypothetical protein